MQARRLIFAEFNELCPWLIDRWMGEGILPNFKRLHDQSTVFETHADVDDPANLEPWIQWYSLHTGLSFKQHGIFHLTDGAKAGHDDIWHAAARAGRRVMNFASMNARPFAFPGSMFVADPWCDAGNANPPELNTYNRFVSSNVQEHSNPYQRLSFADQRRFLVFMMTHGLRTSTIAAIVRQLSNERLVDKAMSWKRATLLDRLQYDVFNHYYAEIKPDLATFFVNSTAHLQHSYWRQFQPHHFSVKPDEHALAIYGGAIQFGYRAMDRMLGDFIALADRNDAMLVFISALSQQPYLAAEETGGKHFYRLRDIHSFFRDHDIGFVSIEPTMTHQYRVRFDGEDHRAHARQKLGEFRLADGRALFDFNDRIEDGLYFSCNVFSAIDSSAIVETSDNIKLRFRDILYGIDATKSGRHHPSGSLWFQTKTHQRYADPVSILDVLPTALDLLDIADRPDGATGRSLMAQLAI